MFNKISNSNFSGILRSLMQNSCLLDGKGNVFLNTDMKIICVWVEILRITIVFVYTIHSRADLIVNIRYFYEEEWIIYIKSISKFGAQTNGYMDSIIK